MWPRACAAALVLMAGSAGGYALRPPLEIPRSTYPAPAVNAAGEPAGEFAHILGTNAVVFVLLVAGTVTGGLSTIAALLTTGFSLGSVSGIALDTGTPPSTLLLLLLPHGIPEVAALLIGGAIGFTGFQTWLVERRDGREHAHAARWVVCATALLCTAAIIETTVTLWLAARL